MNFFSNRTSLINNKLFSDSFMLSIASVFAGGFGYVYQILIGRMLPPEDFAKLSAAVGLVVFGTSFFGAISMLIARNVSSLKNDLQNRISREYYYKVFFKCLVICVLAAPLVFLFSTDLKKYLKLESVLFIWMMYFYVLAAILHVVNYACFQGLQKFGWLAFFAIYAMLAKLFFSVALVQLGYGLLGALLGLVIASVTMVIFGWVGILKYLCVTPAFIKAYPKPATSTYLPVYASTVALAAITQLDVVMVNWFFTPIQTSIYVATSILGKSTLYISGCLVTVIFPMVAEGHAQKQSTKEIYLNALFATLIIGLSATLFFYIFGPSILVFIYGDSYKASGELLPFFCLAMTPISIIILSEHYLIARGRTLFAWIFFLTAPIVLLSIYFFHESLLQVLIAIMFYGLAVGVVGFLFMLFSLREK